MRIAFVASLIERVPPVLYGGAELAGERVVAGHDVTPLVGPPLFSGWGIRTIGAVRAWRPACCASRGR